MEGSHRMHRKYRDIYVPINAHQIVTPGKKLPKFRWLRRPMLLCQLASFLIPQLLLNDFMNNGPIVAGVKLYMSSTI